MITLSRGYNENTFKEDLKQLYNMLGVQKKPTVFVFTAAQVAEEGLYHRIWFLIYLLPIFSKAILNLL